MGEKLKTQPGKFSIKFSDSEFDKQVSSAIFQQSVDNHSEFRVSVVSPAKNFGKLRLNHFPKEVSFSWQDKGLFKGFLGTVQCLSPQKIDLIYRDVFSISRKTSQNSFVRQQTLQDCLSKLVSPMGLEAKFYGNFSENLPGIQEGGASAFERIQSLSDKHGFFFTPRSYQSEVVFVKIGEGASSQKVDVKEKVSQVISVQSTSSSFEKVHFRFFDSKNMECSETELSSQELYQCLNSFTEHSAFHDKMGWKLSGGKVETHATDQYHFDSGQQLLAGSLSKKLMSQEQLAIMGFEPLGLPGDKIQLSNCHPSGLQDGVYLVHSCTVEIQSALPKTTLWIMRP